MKRLFGLIAAGLLMLAGPTLADPPISAVTVSSCGSPPNTPRVGNPYPVTMDTTGILCTSSSGGGGGGTSSSFGSAFPATGTASGFTDGTNMRGARVFDTDSGAGTEYTQGVSIRISGNGGSVEGGTATNPLRVDPTGNTTQPISAAALPLPTGASTSALQGVQGTGSTYNPPTGGSGEIGYLSGIYAAAISTNPSAINVTQVGGSTAATDVGPSTAQALRVTPSMFGTTAAVNVSTATTTQIVALTSSKRIWVTSWDLLAGGTGNATWVYGTGSNCGTGTTSLTGAYNLIAQAGLAKGSGNGAVLTVPAGNALCLTTSAAVQISGSVQYVVEP